MPLIGVYPLTYNLWEVLVEGLNVITNRDVLADLLMQPLLEIQKDYREGKNRYICRERYRNWLNIVQHSVGSLDLPDWEDVISHDEWPVSIYEELTSQGDYEWEIFYDNSAEIGLALESMSLDDEAEKFVKLLVTASKDALIILNAPHFGVIYVAQSPEVETRGPVLWPSEQQFHIFDDIADGEELGPLETYVLPEEFINDYHALVEQGNETF